MGYLVMIAAVFVAAALLAIGDALAIGALTYAAVHVLRHRPWWYVGKVVKGGMVGALAGVIVSVPFILPIDSAFSAESLAILVMFVLAGFGWTALEPARWYWRLRLEKNVPL